MNVTHIFIKFFIKVCLECLVKSNLFNRGGGIVNYVCFYATDMSCLSCMSCMSCPERRYAIENFRGGNVHSNTSYTVWKHFHFLDKK